MRYLSVEEVLALHDYQIERFGGKHGLLNLPLLESAMNRPATNISGADMYKTLHEKAAVLAYSIIKNHPFVDGNKRTGLYAALTFLELNDVQINIPQKKLSMLGLDVANNVVGHKEIASVFKKYSVR